MSWQIEGTYFESCNCEAACPCVFLSNPSEGQCTALVAWHIDRGRLGEVPLNGLNVAFSVFSPGHMAQVKWEVAVYLDASADESQRDALLRIFSGQEGGHPARLAEHVGKILGVASVPIHYVAEGRQRSLSIADKVEVSIEAIEGQDGAEVTIANHPLCIAPGQTAVTARSHHLRYQDYGFQWELSERNGFYSPFRYAA
ncbi:DUF1326 domain-containing protein [Mangrovitalea sediminis]|uniref:DUF1326 domain-containing protein n=1 Tax=Mangrovitalea sediminis TaxID=1982043 RepID=UPI000BE51111|nr:DUF1326 domain-containing protein [Mangrovitalea sediminis]